MIRPDHCNPDGVPDRNQHPAFEIALVVPTRAEFGEAGKGPRSPLGKIPGVRVGRKAADGTVDPSSACAAFMPQDTA
jgi:hypothetical protein